MRPVDPKWEKSQDFGSYATAGVVGNWNGNEVQRLVAQYGNYQPYGHAGVDIACPIGTPVRAMAAGTVIWAGWGIDLPGDDSWGPSGYFRRWAEYKNFPGILTLIQHVGWISEYGHLSSNDAAPVGTTVSEGQVIALSGNTKTPTEQVAPHLHVGALVDLTYSTGNGLIYGRVNPEPFFNQGGITVQGSSTTNPATSTDTAEDIDMATGDQIMARFSEEIAWMDQKFAEVRLQQDSDRNALAGWVRDLFQSGDNVSEAELNAKLADLTTAQPARSGVLLYKGQGSPDVYAWDGATGVRKLSLDEYTPLRLAGAGLVELEQPAMDALIAAAGGK